MDRSYPNSPGVYFFKDHNNQIIYVGKAVSLRDRIRSYFQKTSSQDMMSAWKIKSLLQDYKTIDFIVTPTEIEALLLEAELIREHQPKYNVLLKDGQPFLYLMVT
ncbi:MAG: GIY-YIG nuclease family protein, partial [Candidatus Dependentiae bacterium]|nr:GIY-YIG nuclease family protein [Candidatus Dependentiae bacterium]